MFSPNSDFQKKIISNVTWPTVWVFLNVTLALLNKNVYQQGFDFPIFLSSIHMLVCFTCSSIAVKLKLIPTMQIKTQEESKRLFNTLFAFSFLYIMNIAFGNLSLKIVNLALSQVVRSTVPFVAMFLSYLILGHRFSLRVILSVVPVCVGVALTVYKNQDWSILAIIILAIGIFLAAFKGVMTNKYLVEYKSMHPVEFLMRICPLSFIYLVLFSSIQGETARIMEKQFAGELPLSLWLSAFFTGLCAFFLNWTNFIVTRATSPLTVSVAGNIKQVVTVVLGIYMFNIPVMWWNGLGIFISLIGLVLFSQAKYLEQQKKNKTILITEKESKQENKN